MKRPRYTAEQIRMCANHEAEARECISKGRFHGIKKRPPAEYWDILKKRAEGVSLRTIGREHGNVTPFMAHVLLFRAFVLQEQGLLDRDAWPTPKERAADLTVSAWLQCCRNSNFVWGGDLIADMRNDRDLPQFSGHGEMRAYLRRRGACEEALEQSTVVWRRYRTWRARHQRQRGGSGK